MSSKGIDISYYQSKIDWDNLEVDFVIARAGYGKYASQKDKMWNSHYANAKAHKIPIGAYWYAYATSPDEAKQEAKVCIEILKNCVLEYPVYYDVEERSIYNLGKQKVSAIIKAFCEELEKAGFYVGFYCSASWYNNVVDNDCKQRYTCWIAHWNTPKPAINGNYDVWQYKVGTQPGVTGRCDLDISYKDFPTIMKLVGKNGYKKVTKPTEKPKPVEQPKKKMIKVEITFDDHKYSGLLEED